MKSTQINTTVWERWRRGRRRQRISPSVALESTAAPEITWTPFVSCHNLSVSSQTNRTKRQLYQYATCQAAIKLSVYESSFSRVSLNVKWVYTVVEWHYHRQTAKCHLTNLWVFFTTQWPCYPQLKTSPHRFVWCLPIAVYSEARIPASHVERGECHTCSH